MHMKNPPHLGRIVRQECIEPLGLTVTQAARSLGVTRQTLNNLVNCRAGVSPEMAIRLSKAFGSSPAVWLGMQMEYDLAQAEKKSGRIHVESQVRHRRAYQTAMALRGKIKLDVDLDASRERPRR